MEFMPVPKKKTPPAAAPPAPPQEKVPTKKQFSVYLSASDLQKLKLLAAVQDTDVAALVNRAVGLLLEQHAEVLERALKILDPLSAKD